MMRLWWSSRSPYVRKVMLAAHEMGLADRIERIPVAVSQRTPHLNPGLAADNPAVTIPTLVFDDGTALADSTLICLALERRFAPGSLIPEAPGPYAETLARTALASQVIDILMQLRLYSGLQATGIEARIDGYRWKLDGALARLQGGLAGRPHPDLGDLSLAAALSYLDFRFADLDWRARWPALADWLADVAQRPSFIATAFADA